MRLDPGASAIVVPVEVHRNRRRRTLDMVLDTGATFVALPVDIAESLGYNPTQSARRVELITASAVLSAPLITVQRMQVLGVGASNVDVLCIDLPGDGRFRGLLGLSFLKHFDVDLHFRDRVLSIR